MTGAIVNLVILIPFLILAIVFSKGKGASLIAGYNTMPDSKKAEYDEVALCKFMGKIMYGVCFSLVLLALSELLDNQTLLFTGIGLSFIAIIFALVYTNTNNRFKK